MTVPTYIERSRIAWADTDASGRIYFAAVFRFVESAETGLRRRYGILDDWASYPRRHVEVEYHDALHWDDEIETSIEVARLGRTSITWRWQIHRAERLCASGTHTAVRVGDDGRPKELPGAVRAALSD